KLVWTPGRIGADQFELYNLARDPGENRNVYTSHRAAAEPLETAMADWSGLINVQPAAPKEVVLADNDREILKSLGYMRYKPERGPIGAAPCWSSRLLSWRAVRALQETKFLEAAAQRARLQAERTGCATRTLDDPAAALEDAQHVFLADFL